MVWGTVAALSKVWAGDLGLFPVKLGPLLSYVSVPVLVCGTDDCEEVITPAPIFPDQP